MAKKREKKTACSGCQALQRFFELDSPEVATWLFCPCAYPEKDRRNPRAVVARLRDYCRAKIGDIRITPRDLRVRSQDVRGLIETITGSANPEANVSDLVRCIPLLGPHIEGLWGDIIDCFLTGGVLAEHHAKHTAQMRPMAKKKKAEKHAKQLEIMKSLLTRYKTKAQRQDWELLPELDKALKDAGYNPPSGHTRFSEHTCRRLRTEALAKWPDL
jgi:hypothetical protein